MQVAADPRPCVGAQGRGRRENGVDPCAGKLYISYLHAILGVSIRTLKRKRLLMDRMRQVAADPRAGGPAWAGRDGCPGERKERGRCSFSIFQ